jgi:hypothetical protein
MNRVCTLMLVMGYLLLGCATDPTARHTAQLTSYSRYAGAPVEQFRAYRFSNWEVVGDLQLVIWTEFNEAYLLTVKPPCRQLQWTDHIAITTTVGTVTTLDNILVDRHTPCMIETIRPINSRQMQHDRKQKTPPDTPQAPTGRQAEA